MSLHETARRQRQRKNSLSPRTVDTRDHVLTFAQWCELNAISKATGRRILARGEGPPVLQLSLRLLGIRMSDNIAWQQSRVRASA
jgi:predicted DNA-binding transcriptional regulator AlpA